jgi:hypothetical protein
VTRVRPRYPVYIVSKGRPGKLALTARFLLADGVDFRIVVEQPDVAAYTATVGDPARVLVLPFADLGLGSIPARNWIWAHASAAGAARHWILDDNIRKLERVDGRRRLKCAAGPAFAAVEDFADRYENVAIAGLNYHMFGVTSGTTPLPPFRRNVHVYSCMLIRTDLACRWRGRYNEDTDLCLQVLAAGECTVLVNAFLAEKMPTMTSRGGNSDELYRGDGRLKMARALERNWPGVVAVTRRFKRPQHVVNWRKFTTPLRYRAGVDPATFPANEYGLVRVSATI